MNKLIAVALSALFAAGVALAQAPAAQRPVDAAKAAAAACLRSKAVSRTASPLAARRQDRGMKKCQGAPAAKDCRRQRLRSQGREQGRQAAGRRRQDRLHEEVRRRRQARRSQAKSGCEAKAVSKDGKPLAGAAKTAFMKKCEADAKAAK
jgi:hypothetical protein